MPAVTPKLVVRGQCRTTKDDPHRLRCQCGFVIVSRKISASILALNDHRIRGCVIQEKA